MDTYRSWVALWKPKQYLELYNQETGETYRVIDFRPYVQSGAFQKVIPPLYEEIGDPEKFIYEIWYITTRLTIYTAEITETPRWPLETLTEAGGDCEDLAILAASMLKAAPVNYTVKLVYMDIDNPANPQTVNHVTLYVKYGDYEVVIECTQPYEMTPYEKVRGWFFEAS